MHDISKFDDSYFLCDGDFSFILDIHLVLRQPRQAKPLPTYWNTCKYCGNMWETFRKVKLCKHCKKSGYDVKIS